MRLLGESTDMSTPTTDPTRTTRPGRLSGVGRVLVAVYGVLALAATGRSLVQIVERRGPQLKVVTGFPAEEGA